MKKELFDKMKKELGYIGLVLVIFLIIFKIIYSKEDFITTFRFVLSLFWIFVLPGYMIMLYWHEKLEFMERIIISIALSAAIIGILSYYLGLIGLNIKFHAIILPLILILIGGYINFKN